MSSLHLSLGLMFADHCWYKCSCNFPECSLHLTWRQRVLDMYQVCPETNTVMINIGLLLLAFSNSDEEHCRYDQMSHKPSAALRHHLFPASHHLLFFVHRPNTYHSNLQVSWDLNTGVCCTVGVGDLTEVRGQTRWGRDSHRLLLLSPLFSLSRLHLFLLW